MIGRTVSHYKIVAELGSGSMGAVYKAEDTRLHRFVALKFIHPHLIADEQFKKRFIREAQAASALDHPNICNIHAVDETPAGRPFISMTYYDGVSLAKRAKDAPLPARDLFQICFSIAQGLACAHRNGIVHRDIKPGNVVLTEDGFVKIVDFGLAKLTGSSRLTKTGTTIGTVLYMSPEQATNKEVDHRTDIWSLGVIMYELATGQMPFRGDVEPAIIYSILNEDPQPVSELGPDIPEACARVISRCLEKDPDQRYQSVDELLADMNEMAREAGWGSTIAGLTVPILPGASPLKQRHRLRATSVISVVVVLLALLVVWFARPSSPFTTDVRLAVMPLDNKSHKSHDTMVAGLTDVVYELLDGASREKESMWVAPDRVVRFAELADNLGAQDAFGVNRIVTGDVQRYANGQLLVLELRDAATLDRIRTVSIPFDADSPVALSDSLPGAIARLIELDHDQVENLLPYLPSAGSAIKHYLAGLAALQEKDAAAAITFFEQTQSAAPQFAAGQNALGWAYWLLYLSNGEEAQLQQSIATLEGAAQLAPRWWRPVFDLGEIYRFTGQNDKAIAAFDAALVVDPGNPLVCRRMADVLRAGKRFEEAEQFLRVAIDAYPDYFEARRLLAMHFYRIGEEERAVQHLETTLIYVPDDAFAHNVLGAIYQGRGDFVNARKMFDRAFRLLPNCEHCCNVGLMLYFEKRYRDSASYYEYAIEECGPDAYDIWANWATALYWVDGERERSIELFQTAIDLASAELQQDPDNIELIQDLIGYHAMIGDDTTARRLIARAELSGTVDDELLYTIGTAYEMMWERITALRYLTDAVRHGYPVERISGTRELEDLFEDPRFQRMIAAESEEDRSSSSDN